MPRFRGRTVFSISFFHERSLPKVAFLELEDIVSIEPGHPHVCPIECNARYVCPRRKMTHGGAVAGSQLDNLSSCSYPDVCSVKCQPVRFAKNCERAQGGAVASSQFGHRPVATVRNPHTRSVECDPQRLESNGECAEGRAVAGSQLAHRVAGVICHPHIRSIEGNCDGTTANRKSS